MKIINAMLELSYYCKKRDFTHGYLTISYALQKILLILEFKLKNDDKSPLTFEDKILIMVACECMGRITLNIKYI